MLTVWAGVRHIDLATPQKAACWARRRTEIPLIIRHRHPTPVSSHLSTHPRNRTSVHFVTDVQKAATRIRQSGPGAHEVTDCRSSDAVRFSAHCSSPTAPPTRSQPHLRPPIASCQRDFSFRPLWSPYSTTTAATWSSRNRQHALAARVTQTTPPARLRSRRGLRT